MDRVIHGTAKLNCDVETAFSYFTKNELLEDWLTSVAQVVPKQGGMYELFWNPADRDNDSTIGCKVTAVVPKCLIAFEWKSPKQFKGFTNSADPLTHVVVTFTPLKNGTRVDLIHSGWRSPEEWQAAANWQEQAWQHALKVLESKANSTNT